MRRTKRGGWPYSQPPNVPFEINRASPQSVGLVAWWPMLGSQGGWPVRDFAYGRYPMSPFNTPTWTSDAKHGWAMLFDDAQSEYLEVAGAVVLGYPLTLSAWFNTNDSALEQHLVSVANSGVTNHYHTLVAEMNNAAEPVLAQSRQNNGKARTTTRITANVWHHACGVFYAQNSRAAFLDGGGKGTDADVSTDTGFDVASIGRVGDSSPGFYMSGRIADVRIYRCALTDLEVWQLYANPWELYKPLVRRWLGWRSPAPPPVGGHMTLWGRYWGP